MNSVEKVFIELKTRIEKIFFEREIGATSIPIEKYIDLLTIIRKYGPPTLKAGDLVKDRLGDIGMIIGSLGEDNYKVRWQSGHTATVFWTEIIKD